jgi:ELP3 family radical SAM enzyme/protein acetyltransferase
MLSNNIEIEDILNTKNNINIVEDEYVRTTFKPHNAPSEEKIISFLKELLTHNLSLKKDALDELFRVVKKKHRILPSKGDIRDVFNKHFKDVKVPLCFKSWMIKKNMRSKSGVLVSTIVLQPEGFTCKYDCFYCPQERNKETGEATQPRSYLSNEPAMLRATAHQFDVRGQFWDRVKSYTSQGNIVKNNICKWEVIFSGGTWESYPIKYRNQVINEIYWAANTYNNDRPIKSLEEEITENETTTHRIIGLTIETRPDNITPENIQDYRRWNVTRVQIGVQHYDDSILKKLNRKCYTKDTINALRLLKQCGLKIVCHLMPDLPGSNPDLDKWMFDQLLNRPELMCDDLKIYPTAVCTSPDEKLEVSSKILDWYKAGQYIPYAEKSIDSLSSVLIYFKNKIPPWMRIQRLVRDIPSTSIVAGYNGKSNFRQLLQDDMAKKNVKCHCIRCMEIDDKELEDNEPILVVYKYNASEGIEYQIHIEAHNMDFYEKIKYYFLVYIYAFVYWFFTGKTWYYSGNMKTYDGLYGFLRLRIDPNPGGDIISEINGCGLIRELHVYGQSISVGDSSHGDFGSQHRGFGVKMMKVAEDISAMHNFKKTAVISGVGVREYYKKKCGYQLEQTYMTKNISDYNYNIINRIFIALIIIIFNRLFNPYHLLLDYVLIFSLTLQSLN